MDLSQLEQKLSPEMKTRWDMLVDYFRQLGSAVIAFSGGVDSGLLCAAAFHALGDKMLAVTIKSPVESEGDVAAALSLAEAVGFHIHVVNFNDLETPDFTANPPDRCYVCKLARLKFLKDMARAENIGTLVEGSNEDDRGDYRPGTRAVKETGALSPLQELGFTKKEIRELAHALHLPNWDRPGAPCLATRFPYGQTITTYGLRQVANGEKYLHELGFKTVRVRHHGLVARIEVEPEKIKHLVDLHEPVTNYFKSLGFHYTAVDLTGYRQGSLNEVL